MLKFTYTETGIHLEILDQTLEELIAQRVILALRVRGTLVVEPGTAAFLLPADLLELKLLEDAIAHQADILLCACDAEFVEVSWRGIWLSAQTTMGEGIFLADLDTWTEQVVMQVWQASFSRQSFLIH